MDLLTNNTSHISFWFYFSLNFFCCGGYWCFVFVMGACVDEILRLNELYVVVFDIDIILVNFRLKFKFSLLDCVFWRLCHLDRGRENGCLLLVFLNLHFWDKLLMIILFILWFRIFKLLTACSTDCKVVFAIQDYSDEEDEEMEDFIWSTAEVEPYVPVCRWTSTVCTK